MSAHLPGERLLALKATAWRWSQETAQMSDARSLADGAAELIVEIERLKGELAGFKEALAGLVRAWRAHDDDTGDYERCANELEGLLLDAENDE